MLTFAVLFALAAPALPQGELLELESLPEGAQVRLGSTRLRHAGHVLCVAVAPDGSVVASGARDGYVKLWSGVDGRLLDSFFPGEGAIHSATISPDGGTLAFTTALESLYVKSLGEEDAPVRRLAGAGQRLVASASHWVLGRADGVVRWLDAGSQEELGSFSVEAGYNAADFEVSPTGEHLAVLAINRNKQLRRGGSDAEPLVVLTLLDVVTGDVRHRIELDDAIPTAMTFDQSGERLLCAREGGAITAWRVDTGAMDTQYELGGATCYVLEPFDETSFTVGMEDGRVQLWDPRRPEEALAVETGAGVVTALGRGGDTLVAATGNDLVLLDLETHAPRLTLERHDGPVSGAVFAADGSFVATSSYDGSVRIWDRAGAPLHRLHDAAAEWFFCLAASADGSTLVAGGRDGGIRRWETETFGALDTFRAHEAAVLAVDFLPGTNSLASVSADGTFALWGAGPEPRQRVSGLRGSLPLLVTLPDREELLTAGGTQASIWSAADGALVEELPGLSAPATSVAKAANGSLALGLANRVILVRAADGTTRELRGHTGRVKALAFSPDGATLAAASTNEAGIRLWDLVSGLETQRLDQGSDVISLAFSPDGQTLAAGAMDGNAILWTIEP